MNNLNENSQYDELRRKTSGIALSQKYMSVRLFNCLKRAGYDYLSDVITLDADSVGRIRSAGKQSVDEFMKIKGFVEKSTRESILEFCSNSDSSVLDDTDANRSIISVVKNQQIEDGFYCLDENGKKGFDFSIDAINLSVRACNCLGRAGIQTIRELAETSFSQLSGISGMGKLTIDEILKYVDERTNVGSIQVVSVEDSSEIEKAIDLVVKFYEPCFGEDFSDLHRVELYDWIALNHMIDGHVERITPEVLRKLICIDPIKSLIQEKIYAVCGDRPYDEVSITKIKESVLRANQIDHQSVDELLDEMLQHNRVMEINGYYFKYRQTLKDWIESLKDTTYIVVKGRVDGKTLEEVGTELGGHTRERARQIMNKALRKKPLLFEDGYKDIFEEYGFSDSEYSCLFDVDESVINYLRLIYRKGFNDIYRFIEDESVPKGIKNRLSNAFSGKLLFLGKTILPVKRDSLFEWVFKEYYSDSDITIPDLQEVYNDFLKTYDLYDNETLRFPSDHAFEARVTDAPYCVLKYGKRVRYFDTTKVDIERLLNDVNIDRYYGLEISALKIYVDNQDLMESLDIRDEYELHNILRQNRQHLLKRSVSVARMPLLSVGNANRDRQVRELLFQLSPVSSDSLALEYEIRFGVRKETVLANFFKCIDMYYHNGMFSVEQKEMSSECFQKMKDALPDDFYMWDDVVNIYNRLFQDDGADVINSMTLKQLGFKVYSQYVIRNDYPSADAYFRMILTQSEVINLDELKPGMKCLNSFYAALNGFKDSLDLIEIDKNLYYSYAGFIKEYADVDKEDLINIGRKVIGSKVQELCTFSADEITDSDNPWIEKTNRIYLLNSLVRVLPSIKSSIIGEVCVVARNGRDASQLELHIETVKKHGTLSFEQVVKYLFDEFGVVSSRYKVVDYLSNSELIEIDEILGTASYRGDKSSNSINYGKWGSYAQIISEKRRYIDDSVDEIESIFNSSEFESFRRYCCSNSLIYMRDLVDIDVEAVFSEIELSRLVIHDLISVFGGWVKELNTQSEEIDDILNMFFK